jgi:hypothetical protein
MTRVFSFLILSIFLAVLTGGAIATERGSDSADPVLLASADPTDKTKPEKEEEEPDCE